MEKTCKVRIDSVWMEGEFMGVFQFSKTIPPSPLRGGDSGGVVAFPIAVVKVDGKLTDVKIGDVKFDI